MFLSVNIKNKLKKNHYNTIKKIKLIELVRGN
jgi:hypothetical protein